MHAVLRALAALLPLAGRLPAEDPAAAAGAPPLSKPHSPPPTHHLTHPYPHPPYHPHLVALHPTRGPCVAPRKKGALGAGRPSPQLRLGPCGQTASALGPHATPTTHARTPQAHWERDDLARQRAWAQESKLQATREREQLLEEAQEGLYADALVFGRRLNDSRAELRVGAGQLAQCCRGCFPWAERCRRGCTLTRWCLGGG